ncbi:MAG: nicotinamide mononucleotide transporter [Clostridia bacterium]|nr:nicotinamide mononucleotide transporter [Clostridia bacterium]
MKSPAETAFFTKANLPRLCMIAVTAVLITTTGILFQQSFLRILPLYISLFVGALQARASRYASLLGGCNSILYTLVYWYLGLYASAGYALFFSCPVQIATFIRWSRNKYGSSTHFRRMTGKQRILTAAGFLICFAALYAVLKIAGSSYQLLDNLSSLLGILISVLTMLAFIEYTWLMLPSGIISICLNLATMADYPEQITYVIFSLYSIICVTQQFFRVRKLYREQEEISHH